jgi:hypothetical protein
LFPASMLRSKLFFVRVNRFWCVWIRAPVDALVMQMVGVFAGPGVLRWVV